jgi:hypothetical protein
MKKTFAATLLMCVSLCGISSNSFAALQTKVGDFDVKFNGSFRPETLYGKNIALLNNNNMGNFIYFSRHTIDLKLDILYGAETYGKSVAEFVVDVRDRGIWGSPTSIASTTDAETKVVDSVGRTHRHFIPRHIFWMREAWISFDLAEFLGLSFVNDHMFKVGLFPFSLGRGIALGDAYALGPELIGFYSDGVVDQFAPGALLYGDILPGTLSYDLYGAILQNKSSSLGETEAAILGQEFGRLKTPQRGSGVVNFLIATRLNIDLFHHNRFGNLHIEPYALYNHDPEQRVEFMADASSRLGTVGLAAEYTNNKVEFGFDYALNLGQQRVKGWDRNQVIEQNRNGQVVLVNNYVVDQNGENIPFVSGSEAQTIIYSSFQGESQNDAVIGTVAGNVGYLTGPVILQNSTRRFRNPYTNKYEGWMFVIDGAVWAYKKDLKLAAMTGITTGDDNPNDETIDGVYSGFIPLQEIYSGGRVRSTYLLGGAGRLTRPLSAPTTVQATSKFSRTVNGFSNLVFLGASLHWVPQGREKAYAVNPNVIAYWQEKPSNKFDAFTKAELNCLASTYLGTELNLFAHYMVLKDLKLFFIGGVFFPGTHYRDIKGKPLNATQKELLDRLDVTGFSADRIPNLGDDVSYVGNIGLEFKF